MTRRMCLAALATVRACILRAAESTLIPVDEEAFRQMVASHRGKVLLVDFWATWCAPCIAEIPHFNSLQEDFRGKGVTVIGITIQSPHDAIAEKVKTFDMKYPVLVGDNAVMEGFGGFRGFPTTFVVTQDWKIYKTYTGLLPKKQESIKSDIEKLLAER